MAIFEQDISIKKAKRYIPLSATLIASVLLALSPKEHIMAQEIEEKNSELEMNSLYAKYHSLLGEMDQDDAQQDGVDLDLDLESSRELSVEEVKMIQDQLILFIEKEGEIVVTEAMRKEILTVDELEELFAELVKSPVLEDESSEEEELTPDEESAEEVIEEEFIELEEIHTDKESSDVTLVQANISQVATLSVEKPANTVSYTVRAGDNLNKIAREHNVTVSHIAKLNNISNINLISVGQVLTIQGSKVENESADDLENLNKPMTNNEFVDFLGNHASVAAKEQNLYASVMIAQAALESGFGTSGLSSSPNHNLYGMKGQYEGESVLMRTREYSTAKGWYYVNAHFKKYPSYLESLLDHSAYIRRGTSWAPDYYKNVWRENTTSYRDATAWLQGRYATDPAYANKLNNIIESYNLTRFDVTRDDDIIVQPPEDNTRPEQDVKPSTSNKEADSTPENTQTSTSIYQVKRGDTLSRIALTHKMSLQELKELNNLHSDLILVGQSLKVKKSVVESTPTPSKPIESNTAAYTVKRGDTLSQIAPLYKMSVRELKELNSLQSDLIYVGQVLKVKKSVVESTPTPTKPTVSNSTSYTVKRGDTLSQIAPLYKMSVRELKELNSLQSDLIYVGQVLKVKKSVVESTPTPTKPTVSNSTSYTVKRGDTLSQIAPLYKMSVRELKELNSLQSDLIYVGQVLKVKKSTVESIPTLAPSKPTVSNSISYTVIRGDTLSQIAPLYKMTVRQLKELNHLKSDLIFVGQRLNVNSVDKVSNPLNSKSYQIKAGDTLSALARKFNTTIQKIKEDNNLKSDLIYINQRLTI